MTKPHNFCKRNKMYTHLGRCLNRYGSQSQLENHLTRFIEQEICDIIYMNVCKKIKFKD